MIDVIKQRLTSQKGLLFIAVCVVLGVCIAIGVMLNNNADEYGYPNVVTISDDDPDERPLDNFEWKGNNEDPKYIELNSIGAGGYIQKVDIDQRKEVAVPSNVGLAGWFIKSPKPGDKGLSVIAGHVDGRSQPGIFKQLGKLEVGDEFTVEFGSGEKRVFKVMDQAKVRDTDAPAVIFSQDLGERQLNLVTCGGTWDRTERRYLDRIIIKSIPV